ncbi:MAG: hypothetical protein FJX25_18390 [Alphaproteobacteria bacterium]|nr:hypothetical protein [Alphaproteobacteria bacterium]
MVNEFFAKLDGRAMRLVFDNEGQHRSRWQAVMLIPAKIGCAPRSLSEWIKKAEVNGGKRGHPDRHVREDEGVGAGEPVTAPGQRYPAQGRKPARHRFEGGLNAYFAMADLDRRSK